LGKHGTSSTPLSDTYFYTYTEIGQPPRLPKRNHRLKEEGIWVF